MAKAKILVVEDSWVTARLIQKILERLGHEVTALVASGEEAIKKIEEDKPDLILMDIVLEGKMDGIETAEIIRSRFNVPIIYITSHTEIETLERVKKTEPFGFIIKPFDDIEIQSNIEIALYKHKMEKKLKERERVQKQSEADLALAQKIAHLGSWNWNIVNNTGVWSAEQFRIFGYKPGEIKPTYDHFLKAIHPGDRERVLVAVDEAIAKRKPYKIEFRIIRPNGEERIIFARGEAFRDARNRPVEMLGTVLDITEQKKMENEQKKFSQKLVESLELERKRIALELHDGIAQDLAALLNRLKQPNKKSSLNHQNLKSVTNGIAAAIGEIRNISENLLPSELSVLGLQKSINSLANRMSKNHKVKIQIKSENIPTTEDMGIVKLPDDCKITIYRIVQESLNNAIKHSNASNITIYFKKPKNFLKVIIADDGSGFNPNKVDSNCLGIFGMKERAKACKLCSTLDILTDKGKGTKIILTVSVEPVKSKKKN